MLINTYKPLNTLPDLIPRGIKLKCSREHAHTGPRGISSCPPTPTAPCNPLMPQKVGACSRGGLPSCQPTHQVLCLACVRSGCCRVSLEVAHQVFNYCSFHLKISAPVTNWDPSFRFPFNLIPSLFQKSLCNFLVSIYSGLWSSSSLTQWVLG